MGLCARSFVSPTRSEPLQRADDLPNHSLVLLLPDVGRDLAVDLTRTKGHGDGLGHVFLDGLWDVGIPVGRADPEIG